jgi:hypothetical protein
MLSRRAWTRCSGRCARHDPRRLPWAMTYGSRCSQPCWLSCARN